MQTISSAIEKASRWLTDSGIQNLSRDKRLRGGVAAWYELDKKIYPFLYSEITGYALSTFMFLHRLKPEGRWMRHAELAADWLTENALHKDGGVKTRFYLVKRYVSPNYCFHYGRVYAFDAAMVGYGLLQLCRTSKRAEHYLEAVRRIIGFLCARMRRNDGSFYPYYDSHKRRCEEDPEKWSDQAGAFHAKLALFFVDHHRFTADPDSKQYALGLLDAALKEQRKDGRFVTGRKDGSTNLHPQAYALEGLLYGGVHFQRKDYLSAAMRGFEWMSEGVSKNGSVSSVFEGGAFSHHERSDIVGQTLRLGAILFALQSAGMKRHLTILERMKAHLLQFQFTGDKRQAGGFIYGFAADGLLRNHLNAWSTMFAIQALWMYERLVVEKRRLDLDSFV